jgi:F-type H+/Na+-transporting ATPase subunit alpha
MNYTLGTVIRVSDKMFIVRSAQALGKKNGFIGEICVLGCSVRGIIFELSGVLVKVFILVGKEEDVQIGMSCEGTNQGLLMNVGFGLLGKIVNILGVAMEGQWEESFLSTTDRVFNLEQRRLGSASKVPSIIQRKKVGKPLFTGIISIDLLLPIGRGQRQLIIGDYGIGKTTLALTAVASQNGLNERLKFKYKNGVVPQGIITCIYVLIGQKRSELLRVYKVLSKLGSSWYTCVLFSGADDAALHQYYSPYSGCVLGEWFMSKGIDSLVVFDDLSKHAVSYRQISLLLRRAPGREAYPGDIFFLHSKLLERAAQLTDLMGDGSLTALPIIETLCGDLASYIPTNVISITDGQIFLSSKLFNKGLIPAVDLNLSVSRVGSDAQTRIMRGLSKVSKYILALYRQFSQSDITSSSSGLGSFFIAKGKRFEKLFVQDCYVVVGYLCQILYVYSIIGG